MLGRKCLLTLTYFAIKVWMVRLKGMLFRERQAMLRIFPAEFHAVSGGCNVPGHLEWVVLHQMTKEETSQSRLGKIPVVIFFKFAF